MNLAFESHGAASDFDVNTVSLDGSIALQCIFDLALNVRSIYPCFEREQIGDALDTG